MQPEVSGDFGIYRAFRRRYPDARADITNDVGAEWVRYASRYEVLLKPELEPDPAVRAQLRLVRAFEGTPRPLLMGVYDDYTQGRIDQAMTIATFESLQAMFIRRALVDLDRDIRTVGGLCRELRASGYPLTKLVHLTPMDAQVRLALTHTGLPNAGYVLARIQQPHADLRDLQVEHIYPRTPRPDWSSDDGTTRWIDLPIDEQSRYRTLLNTIGNLTLLEARFNAGASNNSFRGKGRYYAQSEVEETRTFAQLAEWNAASIEARTKRLIDRFLTVWSRPSGEPMDVEEDHVRVVDLERRPGGMADPDIFEYALFNTQVWGDVHNVKQLLTRLVRELVVVDRERLKATDNGGIIHSAKRPHTKYSPGRLPGGEYLYLAWATQYLLAAAQEFISAFGLEDQVKVKRAEPAELPL